MAPYLKKAVESLMLFLVPVFQKIEAVYQKYAPALYESTKQRITDFISSMKFLIFLKQIRGSKSRGQFEYSLFSLDQLLVNITMFYPCPYRW